MNIQLKFYNENVYSICRSEEEIEIFEYFSTNIIELLNLSLGEYKSVQQHAKRAIGIKHVKGGQFYFLASVSLVFKEHFLPMFIWHKPGALKGNTTASQCQT